MSHPLWSGVESLLTAAARCGTIQSYDPHWEGDAPDAPTTVDVEFSSLTATDCQQLDAEIQAFGFVAITRDGTRMTYTFDAPDDGGCTHDTSGTDGDTGGGIAASVFPTIADDPLLTDPDVGAGEPHDEIRLERP